MFDLGKKVLILFEAQKLLLGRSSVHRVGVLHHYIFIISQLRLTFHPRSTVVLLDRVTPGTSREIYIEDTDGEIWPHPQLRNDKYTLTRLLILIIFH